MPKKVGINGFGRIGRLAFRHMMETEDLEVVAANDVAPAENLAYLLRHDSVHVEPDTKVGATADALRWGDKEIKFLTVKNPAELPWKDLGVDIAIESTGLFTHKDDAAKHLDAGAGYVIITAPAKGDVLTICLGVNEDKFSTDQRIISTASCTTNALTPVAKVLNDAFGIVTAMVTAVHAYTHTQQIVDAPAKKVRRGRAAALNIVPTTTGAAEATADVLPELKGKMAAMAMRVPVPCGSIVDLVVHTEKSVTVDSVNNAFRKAAESDRMKGILGVTEDDLVSSDIIGTTYSSLVDAQSTAVVGDRTAKVLAWYDNEWAYARRVADMAVYMSKMI